MTSAENKALMKHLFAELAAGNRRPWRDALADDFCWTVKGRTKWSRRYEGKDAYLGGLMANVNSRLEGGIKSVATNFIAEGDQVVVEVRGEAVTKSGKPYCNEYCLVFRLSGGKLKEGTEYLDTALVEEALGDPDVQAYDDLTQRA